ncbi:MAG: FCD domain-containing protein, partial [Actinobacteria bacterium]|nr:FCD domain-containing protein [Actinomycetota bacterium]
RRPAYLRPLLILASVSLGGPIVARAANLGEAEALFRAGRYEECARLAGREVGGFVWDERWIRLKVEAELATGDDPAALRSLEQGLSRFPSSVPLLLLARDVLRYNGLEPEVPAVLAPGPVSGSTLVLPPVLAEQLGVSRGPVREALQRLIQEGLLEGRPHRGVFVARLGGEDVLDVYRARRAVERAAAELLVERHGTAALDELARLVARMESAADRGRWSNVVDLDRRFHETLVSAAGSPRLTRMFRTLLAETAMCMAALKSAYPVRRDIADEHRLLLEALTAGDLGRVLACIANLAPVVREGYRIGLPEAGRWREALNTDAAHFGGSGAGNGGFVEAREDSWHGLPHSALVTLPPLSVLWLVPD